MNRPMRALNWSVALMLVVVITSSIASIAYQQRVNDTRRAADIAACERGNTIRRKQNAVIYLLEREFGLALTPTTITDCSTIP